MASIDAAKAIPVEPRKPPSPTILAHNGILRAKSQNPGADEGKVICDDCMPVRCCRYGKKCRP